MANDTVALKIADEGVINPADLAEFLYLLRAMNRGLMAIGADPAATDAQVDQYREQLGHLPPDVLNEFFLKESDPADFTIVEISRKSPLELILAAAIGLPVGTAILVISLRVALSGGKIKLQGGTQSASVSLKAEIPPLREVIDGIKRAFSLGQHIRAAFGVRGRTVKLDGSEYAELMQDINGEGGWQDFFLRLQRTVNKQTKELRLTEEDIARIYKYKDQPGDGGFQGRINKIFIRHFPDTRTALPKPKK